VPRWLADDAAMLRDLTETLANEAPNHLLAVRHGLSARDAEGLALAAHTVKGSLSIFGESPAVEAARRLEELATVGDLGAADGVFADLEREVAWLLAGLEAHVTRTRRPVRACRETNPS